MSTPPRPEYASGRLRTKILNAPLHPVHDLYFYLLAASWGRLLAFSFVLYLAINAAFAELYLLGGDCINNAQPGSFMDAFAFSVQTFATIGYGGMTPKTPYANLLVTVESFAGLILVALCTGLVFSKFARPIHRLAFSKNAVIHLRNGVPCLLFRIANERCEDSILNCSLSAHALFEEVTVEGQHMRRFQELTLERPQTPLFTLSWTAIHIINERSPLYGITPHNIHDRLLILSISFEGQDTTFRQSVLTHHIYAAHDILFGVRFADMLDTSTAALTMDFSRLHHTEQLPPSALPSAVEHDPDLEEK